MQILQRLYKQHIILTASPRLKLMEKVVDKYIVDRPAKIGGLERDEPKISLVKPKTLFHSIDRSSLPSQEKTPERMLQEGLTVLFAGAETGARLLAHTVYQLLEHPDVLERVKNEVLEAAAGSNKIPDVKVLEDLPWLV